MSLDGRLAAPERAALRNSDRSPAEHGTARMPLGRLARAIRARSVDPSAWGSPPDPKKLADRQTDPGLGAAALRLPRARRRPPAPATVAAGRRLTVLPGPAGRDAKDIR